MSKNAVPALYQVECEPACGFLTRNHSEVELVPIVITHALNTHNMAMRADDVRALVRRV